MLKVSYASCPGLSLAISAQFAIEMGLWGQNHRKIHKNLISAFKVIQGHWIRWQSRGSVPSYWWLIITRPYLAPLLRYNDLLAKNHKFFPHPLI